MITVLQYAASVPRDRDFLTLALVLLRKFTFKGIALGSVTATLLAGVVIGQIGITIAQPLKGDGLLMFLFAVGYGVGPQFVRVSQGWPATGWFLRGPMRLQPVGPVVICKMVGYDLGYSAGFYSGSQTLSAAMASRPTRSPDRYGSDKAKALIDSMPVAYAVTYMFGTMARPSLSPSSVPNCSASISLRPAKTMRKSKAAPRKWVTRHGLARWELRFSREAGREGYCLRHPRLRRWFLMPESLSTNPPQWNDRGGDRRHRPARGRRRGGSSVLVKCL